MPGRRQQQQRTSRPIGPAPQSIIPRGRNRVHPGHSYGGRPGRCLRCDGQPKFELQLDHRPWRDNTASIHEQRGPDRSCRGRTERDRIHARRWRRPGSIVATRNTTHRPGSKSHQPCKSGFSCDATCRSHAECRNSVGPCAGPSASSSCGSGGNFPGPRATKRQRATNNFRCRCALCRD